jgi:ABC-type multidrug transport system fused ATPase/permease subunit
MDKKPMKNTDEKSQKKGSQYLMVFFFMLIGAVCGVLMISYIDSILEGDISRAKALFVLVILIVGMYLAMFLQTIIHEAGHLVFGLLTGYRFSSFRIGNLMWVKADGKIKFRRMSVAGTGGQCLMCPPDMVDGKIPFVLYNLGGSLMNLIASLLFLLAWLVSQNVPYLPAVFLMAAVIGVGFALTNGIPMRLGTVDNDGYNAKSLGKSADALYSFWVQMKFAEQETHGVRMKNMPREWFRLPDEKGLQNSMTAVMAVMYENLLMDMHRFEEAEALIDQLREEDTAIVGLHSSLLVCDRLYCELIRGKNAEIIDKLRTKEQMKLMKQMKNFPSVIRTEYAYALLYEKNQTKAKQRKAQFEKCAKIYPYTGDIESERELLEIAGNICTSMNPAK